jgi:UDP-N-acetylglucosamine diphosphorylase / glucose-1-phosphate thymidylyltransferase / UDP-N-acetylgalactosamine diphosphorylase / glucosamine-1-phosphate N-acetyltransferase / galactosamine-1-phosphate N-acetyltransferase
MRLCFVEDNAVVDLEPLTLTRPVFDLLLGSSTIGRKIEKTLRVDPGPAQLGALIRPHLAAVQQERSPHMVINDRGWLARGPVAIVNARWVPPTDFHTQDILLPRVGLCEGRPACAWVGPGQTVGLELHGIDGWFEELMDRVKCFDVGGEWVERPWDLVANNDTYLERELLSVERLAHDRIAAQAAVVGPPDLLFIHQTARIDPFSVFDTTSGPISVGPGVVVQPFTRIEGPCSIGRDTQLFRANIRGGVTLGPNCRIGGEVEASIVQGNTNKYHEGFLGHAYVGEWVNLGAITSNSDLRNDYGEVSVALGGDPVPTGKTKVGCFLGDHTRTGLGSMINTGASVGVMCNLLPAGPLLPKHVPSFAAVHYGRVAPGFPLEQLVATARVVKGRRGQRFTAAEEQLYMDLYERTRLERERALQRARDRRGDRWPVSAIQH